MNAFLPISWTNDTVTLRRADFEAFLDAIEDRADSDFLDRLRAHEEDVGVAAARADYLPIELVERLLAGEHPLILWRAHRELSQSQLANAAGVSRSYLAEIEAGKKPGSVAVYQRLAAALDRPVDDLLPTQT